MATLESEYRISVSDGQIIVLDPSGRVSKIDIDQLEEVYVETNDSGPSGIDVWFVLVDADGKDRCIFPLGCTNQDAALDLLNRLEGFEIRGMNSVANMRHRCWQRAGD